MPPDVEGRNRSTFLALVAKLLSCDTIGSFRHMLLAEILSLANADCGMLMGVNQTADTIVTLAAVEKGQPTNEAPSFSLAREVWCDYFLGKGPRPNPPSFIWDLRKTYGMVPVLLDLDAHTLSGRGWIICNMSNRQLFESDDWPLFCSIVAQLAANLQNRSSQNEIFKGLDQTASYHRQKSDRLDHLLPNILAKEIVGNSRAIRKVRKQITDYANSPLNCLVTGETGTGKELVARSLHRYSNKNTAPLIVENVAAIPAAKLECLLFGTLEKAAGFSDTTVEGLFKQADGGTLFLDEIGDLPLDLQAKLLRVIESKTFRPVGSDIETKVDVRLITATQQNLQRKIEDGLFRRDFFYRLAQLQIAIPPLRERKDDIIPLTDHILSDLDSEQYPNACELPSGILKVLSKHDYPGNVRELQNTICSFIIHNDGTGDEDEILKRFQLAQNVDFVFGPRKIQSMKRRIESIGLKAAETEFLREVLRSVHDDCEGNRGEMAKFLRLPVRTLSDKLKKLQL